MKIDESVLVVEQVDLLDPQLVDVVVLRCSDVMFFRDFVLQVHL